MKATVASSSEIWPKAVELRLVNAMRLFTLRMPVAPQGDQMTAAVGTMNRGQSVEKIERPRPALDTAIVSAYLDPA